MRKASDNKFLKVNTGVILTPIIEPVIVALDTYFQKINKEAIVTSGKREAEDQLRIIRFYLESKGLKNQFPEAFNKGVNQKVYHDTHGLIYSWQLGWSKLLNIGVIINPPLASACLLDYWKGGINKRGRVIPPSVHFDGKAFDIGGGNNGIADELAVVQKALKDKLPGLINIVIERENNCIHCDCVKL
jgi:hypothetical protein